MWIKPKKNTDKWIKNILKIYKIVKDIKKNEEYILKPSNRKTGEINIITLINRKNTVEIIILEKNKPSYKMKIDLINLIYVSVLLLKTLVL